MKYFKLIPVIAALLSGIYSARAQTPGGVANANYTWMAWLTPDNYNAGTWTNLMTATGTVGDFKAIQTAPLTANTGGYNFHPVVMFDKSSSSAAPNQLNSQQKHNISSTTGVTSIFVLQRKTNDNYDFLISFCERDNDNAMNWRTTGNDVMTLAWAGTNSNTFTVNQGIFSVDNSNLTTTAANQGTRVFLNGVQSNFSSTQWNGTINNTTGLVALGGRFNTTSAGYGYQGNLQEVILIRTTANGHIDPVDLQKIHSYLAIKYGVSLPVDYLSSTNATVWSQSGNSGYNTNIFGIGRDNASRLNQVQSRSQQSDALTVFMGTTLNTVNDNKSALLPDQTFLMLGSNGKTGNAAYSYQAGVTTGNGSLKSNINFLSNLIYKAQITGNSTMTVSMQINMPTAQFIAVSSDAGFPIGSTRFYPVSNQKATGVVVNNGDFVAFSGYQGLPGGVTNANYTWMAWLTPDSYSSGKWINLMSGTGSVGDFSSVNEMGRVSTLLPPKLVNTGYNYQPSVKFTKSGGSGSYDDQSRLVSASAFNVANKNVTAFFVFKRDFQANYENLFTFYANNDGNIGWYTNNSQALRWYWNSNNTATVLTAGEGMITLDNANSTTVGLNTYVNGLAATTNLATGVKSYNSKMAIATNGSSGSGYGYSGTIQEIIVLSAGASGGHVAAADIQKIHSYLAVKYGITLAGTDNYLRSDNSIIWDKTANNGYNNNIFGIGRDDISGLYQKQSHSVTYAPFSVFVGNALAPLNSGNTTGTLNDKQFLMLGSSGGPPIVMLSNIANDGYNNGSLVSPDGFNIQSPVYKTQLTGVPSMQVNMQSPSNDFLYVLVSSDANFTPGNTSFYPITNRIAQGVTIDAAHPYVKFIGFAPGPGGVNPELRLWLRADDDATINITGLSSAANDPRLTGYPDAVSDPNNVPGVSEWSDLVRGQTYSYAAGQQDANHLMPVYKNYNPEMNYYPSVKFWGSGTTNGAYLSNASPIFPTAIPSNSTGKHTAYFIVNNKFGTNSWVYPFTFSKSTGSDQTWVSSMPYPSYGVDQVTINRVTGAVARFRADGDQCNGTNNNLFSPGATSMLGYKTNTNNSGTNNKIYFRFNAQSDSSATLFNWNNANMTHASTLGSGFDYSRTIQGVMSEAIFYDRELSPAETQQVESYLALKYGITLYPTGTNRFTYKLSTGKVIWDGNAKGSPYDIFYNNVASVLRDDIARLNNTHSHSTNVGSLLHLGVAGTALSADGSGVGTLNNMEAVTFGSDGATGVTNITDNPCGDFTSIFNRIWLVNKTTQDDRPISMLIGAQDNSLLSIGKDSATITDYYSKLSSKFIVSLVVGDSPDSIRNGLYRAVVPMTYLNGEQQCSYTFSNIDTYITFGYKNNDTGCVADSGITFTGSKKFLWSEWTAKTNTVDNPASPITVVPTYSGDLGDSIKVMQTQVTYPVNVRPGKGYPRVTNAPVRGSMELRRRGTNSNDVVLTITFNHPVIPSFSISDIDVNSNSYEQVEVYGQCSGSTFIPTLSYASNPSKAIYKITGNVATASKRTSVSPSDKNGTVNVSFPGGVTSITIKYRTTNRVYTGLQNIFISPITLQPVPPPPPVNEDGLAFTKQLQEEVITTCDPAVYSFYIQNTNCDPKVVAFSDSLPAGMKWQIESVGLDAASSELNPTLNTNNYGGTDVLKIDNLIVPGSATLMLTATALMDEDAPSGRYGNGASISYTRLVKGVDSLIIFNSVDRQTLDPLTTFYAEWMPRQEQVTMTAEYSRTTYSADNLIDVIYTVNNPNDDITDMYLEVEFNPEFKYVDNSLLVTESDGSTNPVVLTDSVAMLNIAGSSDGGTGFILPRGETVIKFTLLAPALANVQPELDDSNQPTGKNMPLDIAYTFSSTMDDPCAMLAIEGLEGDGLIPYWAGKKYIISNRHVTSKIIQ